MQPSPITRRSPSPTTPATTNPTTVRTPTPDGQRPAPGAGEPASGMPGLEGRRSRSPSLSANRAALPGATTRAPGSTSANLRDTPNFLTGIKQDPAKAAAFAQSTDGGHEASLKYIADNVNPNLLYGSALNLFKAATSGGALAMKQNCVYCSTAADQNLEQLAGGRPQQFWAADKTSAGSLPNGETSQHNITASTRISSLLATAVPPGGRAIINVPQTGAGQKHAMNVVHAHDGSLHVIDGQNSKLYNLMSAADAQAFDSKYGHNSGGDALTNNARVFVTGSAPRPVTHDADDWVEVDHDR